MLDFTIIEAGSDYQPTSGYVTSVNGHTGAVTLQIEDIPNLATSIQTINQNLQHKAEKTTVEALSNRVDTFESAINSKAAQTDVNTLSGRVDDAEDDIGALEDELEAKASASDLNALGDRVTTAEGNISSLNTNKADKTAVTDLDASLRQVKNTADTNTIKCKNIIGADAYSSNVNYYPGDMCIYSNTAWKCLVACQDETPEEGTYWTQVSLKSLSEDLTSYKYTLNASATECYKLPAWGPYIQYEMPLRTKQAAHNISEIRLYLSGYGWWHTTVSSANIMDDHKYRLYLTDTDGVVPNGLSLTSVTGEITFT